MDREKNHNAVTLRSSWNIERMSGAGIMLCAILVTAYCVWTLGRGFEITDEAYYLLLAMYSGSVKLFNSAQHWITAGLWQVTGSITLFRASGLILLLASSALLALGIFSACLRFNLVADRFESKTVVIAGASASAMLYASTINLSPCYNLLAAAGMYAAAGLVLLASNRSNAAQKYALFALAGCAVGVELLCKASAGIATFALLVFWAAIFEHSRSGRILGPVVMALGAVVLGGIALLFNTTLAEATLAVEQGMRIFRMVQTESIGARLLRYAMEFIAYSWASLKAFAIPVVAMIAFVMTRRAILAQLGLAALVVTLVFGSLYAGKPSFSLRNATLDSFLFGGFDGYSIQLGIQAVAIFAMLAMALIVSRPVWGKNRSALALFLGLILLPYSVAVGTGNTLFTQILTSLAPWGGLMAMLVVARHPEGRGKMPAALIGLCFMATISLQIVTSGFRPYHLSSPLVQQDQATTVGNLGEVKVDAGTYQFLEDMRAAVKECGIAPGAPFIGLYNIPGLALPLQAVPALTPWLNNREQAEFVMGRMRPEELHSAVIALQVQNEIIPTMPQQITGLPQQMAEFPIGYRYCGMATYPYGKRKIQIWQAWA